MKKNRVVKTLMIGMVIIGMLSPIKTIVKAERFETPESVEYDEVMDDPTEEFKVKKGYTKDTTETKNPEVDTVKEMTEENQEDFEEMVRIMEKEEKSKTKSKAFTIVGLVVVIIAVAGLAFKTILKPRD